MRTLGLLIALLAIPVAAWAQGQAAAEGTRIASTQVSGLDVDRLSPGLRGDIDALVGTPLDSARAWALAARIEEERPGVVASVRALPAAAGDTARVVFFVARLDADDRLEQNINARYTIESAEIEGEPELGISQGLRDDIQALVGNRVDHEAVDRLVKRLRDELPGYDVSRRMSRGTRRGQLRLMFTIRKGEELRWLPLAPSRSKFLYHSHQGWSGLLDIRIGGYDWRVTPTIALDNRDDLLEEYSGFGFRIESRNVGSERIGAGLELSWFDDTWQEETLAALALRPWIPGAYSSRTTVAPSAFFAVTRNLRVAGGVSITELESLSQSAASRMSNAAVLSVGYDRQWKRPEWTHSVEGLFDLRGGTETLGSDLAYSRYQLRGSYLFERGRSIVLASGMAGLISSSRHEAPLFERFSLGDSSTLRGWSKYDVAPVGGDRMFHTSLEYRHRGFALFLDTGSVWDDGTSSHVRTSTGFGYHGDNVFVTVGFPLNTDNVEAMFMAGVRF